MPAPYDRIVRLFVEKLHLEIPSIDTDLIETGVMDSLTFVDLLVQLEHDFGIQISLQNLELDHFRSIAAIAEFISNGT
jgi:acyl carrier protein